MNSITIARIGSHRTVKFAVDELRKYLKMLDKKTIIDVRIYEDYDENLKNLLWVGMSDTFHAKLPEVSDRKQDDAIYIDVKGFCGVVGGNNERSVLIAVYRFLKELGISFLHPGGDGEMIPKRTLDRCNIHVCEAADLRYRVMCIEGALSYEHVYNMIDWQQIIARSIRKLQIFMYGLRICVITTVNVRIAENIVLRICM